MSHDVPDTFSLQEVDFDLRSWARLGSNTGLLDLQSNALPTARQTPSGHDVNQNLGKVLYAVKIKNSNGTTASIAAPSGLHNEDWYDGVEFVILS